MQAMGRESRYPTHCQLRGSSSSSSSSAEQPCSWMKTRIRTSMASAKTSGISGELALYISDMPGPGGACILMMISDDGAGAMAPERPNPGHREYQLALIESNTECCMFTAIRAMLYTRQWTLTACTSADLLGLFAVSSDSGTRSWVSECVTHKMKISAEFHTRQSDKSSGSHRGYFRGRPRSRLRHITSDSSFTFYQ